MNQTRLFTLAAALSMALLLTGCDGTLVAAPPGSSAAPSSSASTPALETGINLNDGESYEEGGDYGYIGDVMHTYFMDFAVGSAYTCPSLGGYTPAEGFQLLVVELSVKNTMTSSLPMYDTDFQAQWGEDDDEAYVWPITTDAENVWDKQALAEHALDDNQLPPSYELAINGSRSGLLIYEVPADRKDFSISFQEYFDDDTTGDAYFIYFTAEEKI